MNESSWVFGSQRAEVARDGSLDWVVVGFGSGNGKVRTETLLAGEGSHAKVTGAYAPHARQHIDFHTHAGARRGQHDERPRVPRHPRRPVERRLARA